MRIKHVLTFILILILTAAALGSGLKQPASAQTTVPGDPAASLGKPSGQDTFDSASHWSLFDSTCFKSEIKNGKYVMTAKGKYSFPELNQVAG